MATKEDIQKALDKANEKNQALLKENETLKANQPLTPNVKDPSEYLPAAVAKEYELIDWVGGHRQIFGSKFGVIDLSKLTPKKAAQLIARGFTKLRKK